MNDQILEWAPFRLKSGVDEAALLRSSDQLQNEFLAKQDGFLRRELRRRSENEYVDLIWWRSLAAAEAATSKVADSPACGVYFNAMILDETNPEAGIQHLHSVRSY